MALGGLLLVVAGISFLLTWSLRRYALARSLLDIPNARSSHTVPTPRGGGVAIVLAFLLGVPALLAFEVLEAAMAWAILGAGALVALVGFIDDHRHLAARWRLAGHFAAALWALYWLEGMPALQFLGMTVALGWIGYGLTAFYLVWLLNLYNFMDGIDGLASIEAVCVCLGGALLYGRLGEPMHVWLPLMLAAAVLGFLPWNFPRAKIFMGDAGSGFLGVALGVLSLQAAWVAPQLLCSWLILLGVFLVDATWTLVRRLSRGDRVYEAHRSHAYQYAARNFGRHWPVTVAVMAVNIVWLLPLSLWVGLGNLDGIYGLLLAYTPLLGLAIWFQAGALECPKNPA